MKICVTKGIRSLFVIIFMLLSICLTGFAQSTENEGGVSDDQAIEAPEENIAPKPEAVPLEPENAQPLAAGAGPSLIPKDQQISFENKEIIPKSDLYTGAATYSIPIVVPPGRGGIAVPSLSLVYNSQSKNGICGMGWDLNFGGFIQRSTKKGLHYNLNEFAYNGSTELVPISGNKYQAKIEGEFTQFFFLGETSGWEVITRDGTKYYYGDSTAKQPKGGISGKYYKWFLTKILDTNGNQLTIDYWNEDYTNGQCYIEKITYSGNRIEFDYFQTRPDNRIDYNAQFKIETKWRLRYIKSFVNGGTTPVRTYELSYSEGSNAGIFTRLEKVEINTSPANNLLPTEFTWTQVNTNGTFGNYHATTLNASSQSDKLFPGDLNGDGLTDIVQLKPNGYQVDVFIARADNQRFNNPITSTLNAGYSSFKIWLADMNGDGAADLIQLRPNLTSVDVYLSNKNGSFQSGKNSTLDPSSGSDRVFIGDMNGDGKADLVQLKPNLYTVDVYISNGTGGFQARKTRTLDVGYASDKIWLADVNGDGKTDLLQYQAGSSRLDVYKSIENGNFEATRVSTTLNDALLTNKLWLGDINGDGLVDVIQHQPYMDYRQMDIYFSKGDGSFDSRTSDTLYDFPYTDPIYFGDVNGDGMIDIVRYQMDENAINPVYVYLSRGNGTFATRVQTLLTNFIQSDQIILADINGDNLDDLLQLSINSLDSYLSQGKADYLITKIGNGMGGWADIQYAPSFTWPNEYLPFKVQTVTSITTNDGRGNASTNSYTYNNGYYDVIEREFRGFGEVTQINPNLTAEKSFFNQKDYYYKGRIEKVETRTTSSPSSPLMYRITNTWAKESLGGSYGRTFVKLNRKLTENFYSPTVSIQEDFTYNNNHGGVLTQITSSPTHPSPESITKTNEYQNYGSGTNGWVWRTTIETLTGTVSGKVRETYSTYYPTTGNLWTKSSWEYGKTPDQYPKVEMTYDSYGNVTSVKDALGNITSTEYESTNTFPDKITAPQTTFSGRTVNHITEALSYDYRCGKPTQTKDENGNVTTYTYDALGRLTQVDQPDTGQIFYTYYDSTNPRYILTQAKEANGQYINKYEYYDGLNRKFQTVTYGAQGTSGTLAPIYSVTYYDNMGRAYREEGPYYSGGQTPYVLKAFDLFSRVTNLTSPDSTYGTVTTGISYAGLETTTTDSDTRQKKETKDYLGRTTAVTEFHESGQFVTNYTYNAAGDLGTITTLEGTINMVYDTLGRKTSMNHPDLGYWTYTYDKNNNLKTQTDAKGQVITFDYDALNRMVSKQYSTGQTTVLYIYDNDTAGLNGIGRLYATIQDTNPAVLKGFKTENTYDLAGKPTSVLYPDSTRFNYEYYPGTGLLKNVLGAGGAVYANLCLYEPTGKIGQVTSGNNVRTRYTYDGKSTRLTGVVTEDQASVDFQNRTYTYSRAGDITQIQDFVKNITYTYTYDNLHRLLTESNTGSYNPLYYTYSPTGNILSKTVVTQYYLTYGYSHPTKKHAVTRITYSGTSANYDYAYDNNGNMTQGPDFTNISQIAQRRAVYDADNMPTQVWASQSGVTTYFSYDGDGDRVKKTTTSGATTYYVGDHYEVKNDEPLKYIFAGNLRLIMIKGTNTFYYHKDHLGSTSVMTNNSGAVVETAQYEPFGATRDHTGQDMSGYKFTDQELDNETNLYNYDARLYDPVIGRFGKADSVMQDAYDPQSLNAYSYCRNNPLIYTDPTGHMLVAVDGTDSANWREKREDGTFNSNVANFFIDYACSPGERKELWDGPGGLVGKYDGGQAPNIHKGIMNFIMEQLSKNPSERINLVGFSRGGYIVMEVARELGSKGIRVNFLGLFDAVDMAPGYGKAETVPSNVDYAAHAMGIPEVGSRTWFNTANHGAEDISKMKSYDEHFFDATHAGIGGDPWGGDHPKGMTWERDVAGSMMVRHYIRKHAGKAGIKFNQQ